jgi:hypothetical protein
MKIWVDDTRPAPKGYVRVRSVNEAKLLIIAFMHLKQNRVLSFQTTLDLFNRMSRNKLKKKDFEPTIIDVIDLDHDAGDYAINGGDYIKILDWLVEQTVVNKADPTAFPLAFHTMNTVGRETFKTVAERYGFPILTSVYESKDILDI